MDQVLIVSVGVLVLFFAVTSTVIDRARKQQTNDPDGTLDGWFDGRRQVVVTVSKTTLGEDTVLEGANARGYRLTSTESLPYPRSGQTKMVFDQT